MILKRTLLPGEQFAALIHEQAQAIKALDAVTTDSHAASTGSGGLMEDTAAEHLRLADEQVTVARDKVRAFAQCILVFPRELGEIGFPFLPWPSSGRY